MLISDCSCTALSPVNVMAFLSLRIPVYSRIGIIFLSGGPVDLGE